MENEEKELENLEAEIENELKEEQVEENEGKEQEPTVSGEGMVKDAQETDEKSGEPDTSEEEPTKAKTYTEEEVKELMKEKQDAFNKNFNARFAKIKSDHEKELGKYKELDHITRNGIGTQSTDETIETMRNYYKQQKIDIPEYTQPVNVEDEKILGEARAKRLLDISEEEARSEANRIYAMPQEKRSIREQETFRVLVNELADREDYKQLKTQGADETVLNSEDFKNFMNQYSLNRVKAYELFSKIEGNVQKKEAPPSTGSAKGNSKVSQYKDFYTQEEAEKLTEKDYLGNPKLLEIVEKSSEKW